MDSIPLIFNNIKDFYNDVKITFYFLLFTLAFYLRPSLYNLDIEKASLPNPQSNPFLQVY